MLNKTKEDFNQVSGIGATFYFKNKIEYKAIPTYYLKDKLLSIKAKGLLSIIYSLPEDWEYSMKGLAKISNLTEKQLRPILNELIEKKYIRRDKKQEKISKKFYYEYWIFIEPYFEEFEILEIE